MEVIDIVYHILFWINDNYNQDEGGNEFPHTPSLLKQTHVPDKKGILCSKNQQDFKQPYNTEPCWRSDHRSLMENEGPKFQVSDLFSVVSQDQFVSLHVSYVISPDLNYQL